MEWESGSDFIERPDEIRILGIQVSSRFRPDSRRGTQVRQVRHRVPWTKRVPAYRTALCRSFSFVSLVCESAGLGSPVNCSGQASGSRVAHAVWVAAVKALHTGDLDRCCWRACRRRLCGDLSSQRFVKHQANPRRRHRGEAQGHCCCPLSALRSRPVEPKTQ